MTTLPALYTPSQIVPHDASARNIVAWALSGATRPSHKGPLELINYPSKESRAVLGERLQLLAGSLGQQDHTSVADAVTRVLLCYPALMKEGDAKHKRQVVAKYVTELQGVAAWACIHACDAIREGRALSPTYPPSTIEVRALALSYTQPIRDELTKIDEVLRATKVAPPVDADAAKEICGKLKTLAVEIGQRDHERIGTDDEGRQRVLAEYGAKGRRFILREYGNAAVVECAPGIPISRSLAAKIAAPRESGGW